MASQRETEGASGAKKSGQSQQEDGKLSMH